MQLPYVIEFIGSRTLGPSGKKVTFSYYYVQFHSTYEMHGQLAKYNGNSLAEKVVNFFVDQKFSNRTIYSFSATCVDSCTYIVRLDDSNTL